MEIWNHTVQCKNQDLKHYKKKIRIGDPLQLDVLYITMSIYLYVCQYICLCLCRSVGTSLYLYIHLFVCLYVCHKVRIFWFPLSFIDLETRFKSQTELPKVKGILYFRHLGSIVMKIIGSH